MSAVDDYVARVDKALRGLPRSGREEIVGEIAEHARAAVAELDNPNDAAVRTALERIGDPDDIAAEARERFGIVRAVPTWREPVAIGALLIGWLIPPFGTLIGLVALWTSRVWSGTQKVAATLAMPAGVLLPAAFVINVRTEGCSGPVGQRCTNPSGGGLGPVEIVVMLFVFALIGAVTASLIRSLRQARHAALAVQ
jgi:hypothetical protein